MVREGPVFFIDADQVEGEHRTERGVAHSSSSFLDEANHLDDNPEPQPRYASSRLRRILS